MGLLLVKVLYATICGAIIGLEREVKHKAAGLKTNVLICVASMLFTHFSILSGGSYAQVISGVGFLGGGALIRTNDRVSGLTTASMIWTVSALGIGVGIGHGEESVVICLIITLIVYIINIIERNYFRGKHD